MMTPEHAGLWRRIQRFELDEPAAQFTFGQRLARENGWDAEYTLRVIEEYKKFIFLCCVSPDGVTPSDAVDQAWHLHLTYTESYWSKLCRDTLGQQIHHNPTKGGTSEAVRYDSYYTSTAKLYSVMFGQEPPTDIWPDNEQRFSDINFKRVNIERYWLVRRPKNGFRNIGWSICLTLIVLSFFADDDNRPWVIMLAVTLLVTLVVYNTERRGDPFDGKRGQDGTAGCNSDGPDYGHHGGHSSHHSGDSGCGHSGCGSGCSGCSSSGCSGCSGGH